MGKLTLTECDKALKKRGIYAKKEWIAQIIQQTPNVTEEILYKQFLYSDMRETGAGCVDKDISSKHKHTLSGPFVLQINQLFNAGESNEHRYEENSSRLLKLSLTDGIQIFFGFEYKKLPTTLHTNSKPGIKIKVQNVIIRRGMLLLQPQNTEILGGSVLKLCQQLQELQVKRKSKREPSVRPEDIILPPTKRAAYPSMTGAQPIRTASTNSLESDQDSSNDITNEKLQPISTISGYFHKTPPGLTKYDIQARSSTPQQDFSRRKSDSSTELVVDLVGESPSDVSEITSVRPTPFIADFDDEFDDELDAFLDNVEGNYVPKPILTNTGAPNRKLVSKGKQVDVKDVKKVILVEDDVEFLVDQIRSPNTPGFTTKIKGAIIKTRSDVSHENGLLTIATIDDGTQQTEVILHEKLKNLLRQAGCADDFSNVAGIMTLVFPKVGTPILQELSNVQSSHIRSLLSQVKSHFRSPVVSS